MLDNLIKGLRSIVDVFGVQGTIQYDDYEHDDYEALKSDWTAIGIDIKSMEANDE